MSAVLVRRAGAVVVVAIVATVAGCASLRPRLPEPEPGLQRVAVQMRSSTCTMGRCTTSLDVGGARVQVRGQARTMSPEEAIEVPRESLLRRAAAGVRGSIVRGLGGETSSYSVGRGTRTARDEAATLAVRCDVVWVDEQTERRENGEDVSEMLRLGQGVACTAATPTDSATTRWRFRAGISPEVDSLRVTFETMVLGGGDFEAGSVTLDRIVNGMAMPYSISGERITITGIIAIPGTRWTVRRRDGTLVGAILRSMVASDPGAIAPGVTTAVDLAPAGDPEESMVLRLIASCLAEPFVGTR